MGSVRQRQLIRLSSVLVAVNLVVGFTVLYAHSTDAAGRQPRSRLTPGASPAPSGGSSTTAPSDAAAGGLAAGHFSKRRGSATGTSGPAAPGAPAPSPAPTGTGPSSPVVTTGPPATATTRGTVATTSPTSPAATTPATGKPPAATPVRGTGTVTDPAGDTVVDGTQKPITEPPADIVAAGAAYGPGGLTFTLQTRQPDDPRTDPKWSSDATYVAWDVDTNGDGKPDFEVQYSYDGTAFSGTVIHPGDDDSVPEVCDATAAGYGSAGYSVTIDPVACLGNPASFSFSATIRYDTNPKNDNAAVASDVAPDGGLSFPVTRPS